MVIVPLNLMFTTTTVNSFNRNNGSLIIPSQSCYFAKKTRLGISSNMWRNVGKQACKGLFRARVHRPPVTVCQNSVFPVNSDVMYGSGKKIKSGHVNRTRFQLDENFVGGSCSNNSLCLFDAKGYSSVAEADVEEERGFDHLGFQFEGYSSFAEAVSSTDLEEDSDPVDVEIRELLEEMKREEERKIAEFRLKSEAIFSSNYVEEGNAEEGDAVEVGVVVDEVKELLDEMKREEKRQADERNIQEKNELNLKNGMKVGKFKALRKRQVKIETEVWQEAAKEYQELLVDMCQQKLAPNLPYMKSLFLGWFEPLKDAIEKEQEMYRSGKRKTAYSSFFVQLPSEKMAVITMHKIMGLLMSGTEKGVAGTAKVIQAVCILGDAIEQEVRMEIAFLVLFLCLFCWSSSNINSAYMFIEIVQIIQFHII